MQVPRSGPSAAVIPCAKTSANVGVRGNAATNKPVGPVQYDPDRKNREERKVVDEREMLWTTSPYPPATSTQDSNLPPGNSRPGGCPL